MALCDLCKSIDLNQLSKKDTEHFHHHQNHKDLLASRDEGCPLCALFVEALRQGMDHPGEGIDLRLEPFFSYDPFHHENGRNLTSFNVAYSNIPAAGSLNVYADEGRPIAIYFRMY
jgi:hypothetical protein